jgi:RNA 2',3'-cyclic 3'-phosphodiesterase
LIHVRLFIAFSFSSDVSDRIEEIIESFEQYMTHGRTTKRNHFHVTLVFLGDTNPERLPMVKAAMDAVSGKPFELDIKSISAFKGRRKGDTFYLNIQPDMTLFSLEKALRLELKRYGFSVDERPYHPHVTIARNAILPDSCALSRLNDEMKAINVTIDRIELFQSTLTKQGPVYTILYEKRF